MGIKNYEARERREKCIMLDNSGTSGLQGAAWWREKKKNTGRIDKEKTEKKESCTW